MTKKRKVENKEVFGFSRYSVNVEEAKVYDHKNKKYKKINPNSNGYVYISLVADSGKTVCMPLHRFIYMAHIGYDLPDNMVVDHVDGDTTNNSISNLELLSQSENLKRRKKYKRTVYKVKELAETLNNRFKEMNLYHGSKMDKFKILADEYNLSVRSIQKYYKFYLDGLVLE